MPYNYGAGSACQIGKETTWGTAVTPTLDINFTSESINYNVEKGNENTLISSKSATSKDIMVMSVDGSVDFVARPDSIGLLVKASLGGTDTVTANNPVTGAYRHVMILQDAATQLPALTFVVDRKQAVKKYSGAKVKTFSLTAKAGDYVRGQISFLAKDESSGVKASLTASTLKSYKCKSASVVAGGTTLDAISVKLTVDNALEFPAQTLQTAVYLGEPNHGQRIVTAEIEVPLDTNFETIRNTNYLAETLLSTLVISFSSESIVTGATNYSNTITLNNVCVTAASANVGSAGQLTGTISCQALAVGSTEPISWQIIDATTTAY